MRIRLLIYLSSTCSPACRQQRAGLAVSVSPMSCGELHIFSSLPPSFLRLASVCRVRMRPNVEGLFFRTTHLGWTSFDAQKRLETWKWPCCTFSADTTTKLHSLGLARALGERFVLQYVIACFSAAARHREALAARPCVSLYKITQPLFCVFSIFLTSPLA